MDPRLAQATGGSDVTHRKSFSASGHDRPESLHLSCLEPNRRGPPTIFSVVSRVFSLMKESEMKDKLVMFLLMMASLLIVNGCATNRGILNLRPTIVQQPASGQLVKIESVRDIRVFELRPRRPSIPSLRNGEITNRAITTRAIARKRNTYGKALGDILLPEGRTVEDVVAEVLTSTFREAGYRVVSPNDPEAGSAVPIKAEVEQFWSWFTPGMWAISLEFEARVKISGNISPFQRGEVVRGYVRRRGQAANTRAWDTTINQGIGLLSNNIKSRLRGLPVSQE